MMRTCPSCGSHRRALGPCPGCGAGRSRFGTSAAFVALGLVGCGSASPVNALYGAPPTILTPEQEPEPPDDEEKEPEPKTEDKEPKPEEPKPKEPAPKKPAPTPSPE